MLSSRKFVLSSFLALTGPIIFSTLAQDQSSVLDIRVIPEPSADRNKIIATLRRLGFVWDSQHTTDGEFWGRLPSKSAQEVERVPGINWVVIEPGQRKPVAPERYQVWMRILLSADARVPGARYIEYHRLIKQLGEQGFLQAPLQPQEWLYNDILRGEIAAHQVPYLLAHHAVRTVLLTPWDSKILDAPKKLVFIEIWLGCNFRYQDQQVIKRESLDRLAKLGFVEAYGYDDEFGVRLLGWLPAERLLNLLDVQHEYVFSKSPETDIGSASPTPLFRMIEVLGTPGQIDVDKMETGVLSWPEEIAAELKLSPELRTLLAHEVKESRRVEVIFRHAVQEKTIQRRLADLAPSLIWEGSLGPIAWMRARAEEALAIAKQPDVSSIRLAQAASDSRLSAKRNVRVRYLKLGRSSQRSDTIQSLINWKAPMRVAVIGVDFHGWQERVGNTLPRATYYIDYTRRMNERLAPEPAPSISDGGLFVAEQLCQTGAVDELYLVRIHESAPYQILQLLEYIHGSGRTSTMVEARFENLKRKATIIESLERELRIRRASLVIQFREDDPNYWKLRDEVLEQEKKVQALKRQYMEELYRIREFQEDLARLQGIKTIVIVPVWRKGYASLADSVPMLRWNIQTLANGLSIIQVVPEWTASDWFGWLQDVNNNEAIEFRDVKVPEWVQWNAEIWQRRHGSAGARWGSPELNWLAWQPSQTALPAELQGTRKTCFAQLPPRMTVEIILQWKEVHDPRWYQGEIDVYQRPLTPWVIEILEPIASAGTLVPQDVYRVVTYSRDLPERIEHEPRYSVYEMRLRFRTGEQGGRYAVRLRARTPVDSSPVGMPHIRGEMQETWFRLSAEVPEGPHREQGRLVWLTSPRIRP
ncbi:MAG: hypothetical protein RMI91_09230 [Gemmatales bacterium]|nr:hypothetical protein [Gemmatales bacterium]MDW7994822.1 hypothetical protein [Gemmatales bacterium]